MSNDRAVYKNVWLSSWVLSVSLLGDALLYIVLPINADAFGISIATVGFLLAINRIIRTFTYNLVVNLGQAIGPKETCCDCCLCSCAGHIWLCHIRRCFSVIFVAHHLGLSVLCWIINCDITFCPLKRARKRAQESGLSRSVEQVGPLIAMLVGAWLVTSVGPRDIFLYLGLASILSIVLAVFLVDIKDTRNLQSKPERILVFPCPNQLTYSSSG